MPYCSNCGTEIEGDERYCPECGAAVGGATRSKAGSCRTESGDDPALEHDTESILDYAIGYPRRNGWGTVLIGGVLTLFWFLLVPIVLTTGYFVRLTEAVATRRPAPPRFDNWGELLRLGVLAIVAFVPFVIVVAALTAAVGSVSDALAALVSLAAYYVAPAIFLRFAVTQTVSGTYDVDALQELLTDGTYAIGLLVYVVAAVLGSAALLLVSVLSVLTLVGWILIIPAALFYYMAFLYAVLGRIYVRSQLDGEPGAGVASPGRARRP